MVNSKPWALTALSPKSHEVIETRHLENEAAVGSRGSTACVFSPGLGIRRSYA